MKLTNIEWTDFSANPLKYRDRRTGAVVWVRTCSGCQLRVRTREVVEAVIGDGPAESRSGSGHTPSIV